MSLVRNLRLSGQARISNGVNRERVLSSVILALFILLFMGLFYTQIIRHNYYSRLSKSNSIRIIPIEGPRGNIYDRNGVALVTSRMTFNVALVYQELKDRTKLARVLSGVLGMDKADIIKSLESSSRRPYAPVTIAEDIDKDKALELEEESFDLSGLVMQTGSKRAYPYGALASHVFGYLSEITESELEAFKDYGYRSRDLVGRDGIEKYYDTYLKGVDGGVQVEVDARGRQTRVLGMKEPSSGKDLRLTIDIGLESECDKLLANHNGAVIVMDPNNGEVLALVSHPAFDPGVFVKPNASAERMKLLRDKAGRPMSNRAISGLYPPGSVFKVVTAAAALETKRINSNTHFFCPGTYRLGNAKFDCWKEGGHGSQDVVGGLMNSCNVFFYNTGKSTGVDSIESCTRLFGYGRPTLIDLPDEVKGIVPGRLWKRLYRNDNWYEGETVNYAIGQGYLLVTPIQVLQMASAIANKGSLVKPFLVKGIDRANISGSKQKHLGLKDSTVQEVRKGMYEVINNENGTGKRARTEGVIAAGKTGTAENPQGKTHAWFTGFAPYDKAKICVVVFLEHGGKGGIGPAEIAHGIFQAAKDKGYL